MAKYNEEQRAEAYRVYMSDSLTLCNRILSHDKFEIPRYYDLKSRANKDREEELSSDDIIANIKNKANVLRGIDNGRI